MAEPILAGSLSQLVERAGLAAPFGLLEAVEYGIARRALIAVVLPRSPIGLPVGASVSKPAPAPAAAPAFARMSAEQRIRLLLERTPKELAPDLARAFQSMTGPEAKAAIVASLVVLLLAQCAGVGEIVDAALAWWAYRQAGLTGLAGLYEALRAVVSAVRAENEGEFDQAVKRFAEGLTLVGVALLTVVVTRAASKRAGGAEGGGGKGASSFSRPEPEPRSQRWSIAPAVVKPKTTVAVEGPIDEAHVVELAANGIKFTQAALVATGRTSAGRVVFLETGNARAGLQHIVEQHGADFAKIGVPEAEIPSVVMRAVTEGKIVGYQGRDQGRAIYEILLHQQNQRIAVSVGNNGFIVGANPAGRIQ